MLRFLLGSKFKQKKMYLLVFRKEGDTLQNAELPPLFEYDFFISFLYAILHRMICGNSDILDQPYLKTFAQTGATYTIHVHTFRNILE